MRKPFIAGNWKMNTTIAEALALVSEMFDGLNRIERVDRVICPPCISLQPVKEMIRGTSIELGAQNIYYEAKGAFTGEISAVMLKGLCKYVIIGHSERRQYFSETDSVVNAKVKSALAAGLLPILCIGETLAENEAGKTGDVLSRQVKAGLQDVSAEKDIVLAYEPIWAIGTGKAASGQQAGQTIGFIRDNLSAIWGHETAELVRILYGGSVTVSNIAEFIREPQIDGALVGGASLKAIDFIDIVRQAAALKQP